jgi:phosphoglycerate dehydrogenase-like enzyme
LKPRLVVLAPDALFRSFFDDARRRRLDRSFRWVRLTRGVRAALADADGLITTWDSPRFGPELRGIAPRLRIIGHCGGEVRARFARPLFARCTITNAPAPMARYVAELAVTFLLHAARNVDAHRAALRRGSTAVYRAIHEHGVGEETILGQTVGVVGFGKIGRAIAALLRPFGVNLLIHDPYVSNATASWPEVLKSRYLVLAAALTEQTRGMLDRRSLAQLPDGAVVINVARGGLVDMGALTMEVRRGRLRCALDVTDPEEPLPPRHPLRRARGALVTPHVGAAHREVRARIADTVMDDLERFFGGKRVRNRVTEGMLERMT